MITEFSNQFTLQLKKVLLGSMLMLMALILGACSDDTTNGDGTTPPVVLPFDLGKDFTIASLGKKNFTQAGDNISKYSATDISLVSSADSIIVELKNAITTKLEANVSNADITFGDAGKDAEAEPSKTLTITVKAIITETGTENEKSNDYTFTITFNDTLKKWDGSETPITETVDNVYEIYSGSDLAWIAQQTRLEVSANDFATKTVRFMSSVDMDNNSSAGGNVFTGIGTFKGRLEGNHKTIYGLKIEKVAVSSVGLIGQLGDGGSIDNLTIAKGSIIKGQSSVGAFVGSVAGSATVTIKGVTNHATIEGNNNVGGLVGNSSNSSGAIAVTIDSSSNTGNVKGTSMNVGGLVGAGDTLTIDNSSNTGNVKGTGTGAGLKSYVGGLVGGSNTVKIDNSSNIGMVTGTGMNKVGGLVGRSENVTIDNSSNTGTVAGKEEVGGLVGYGKCVIDNGSNTGSVTGTGTNKGVGGLVGYGNAVIDNSLNIGVVTGTSNVGGLVGDGSNLTIDNSLNTGSVTGTGAGKGVGGLVGQSGSVTVTITNSHSYANSVTGGNNGGIVGMINSGTLTATNVYWLHDGSTGIEKAVDGGTLAGNSNTNKLTIAQFKEQASFKTWDFVNVWEILANGKYPTLKNLVIPVKP